MSDNKALILAVFVVILVVLVGGIFGLSVLNRTRQVNASVPVTLEPAVDAGTPAPTGSPEILMTPTNTPRYTPIPNLSREIIQNLPAAPKGFSWKVMPDLLLDTLIPDGWFFSQNKEDDIDVFYVTKSPLDENGDYSIGMSVKVFRKMEHVDDYALQFIGDAGNDIATVKIVDKVKIESESKTIVMYSIMVEAEYPDIDSSDPNKNKKLVYNAIADTYEKSLYFMTFECPKETWDDEWKTHGGPIMLSVINLLFAGR